MPLTALPAAFAAAMDRLGPWDADRRVAVAVSGGADSLALALLTQQWGRPVALIVDHGLRPGSAAEAEAARAALAARGMPARVLRLTGLHAGPGLAKRARTARYAALTEAGREAGLVDLLLGHHAGDQAETVLMRQRRGSGPAGLAGMAALVETDQLRLVRPLLGVDPAELRAFVASAGLVPAEDPTNADERTLRARLRREIGTDRAGLLALARDAGRARTAAENQTAGELAQHASIYPQGYAVLSSGQSPDAPAPPPLAGGGRGEGCHTPNLRRGDELGSIGASALGALLRSLSGRRYPVDASALAASPRAATLGGVRMQPAGRAGSGWLLTREASQCAPALAAAPGAVWDGRFRVDQADAGAQIGALGQDARHVRSLSPLPGAVLETLPALRYNGALSAVPHLSYPARVRVVVRSACLPAAGAPFLPC